MQQPRSVTVVLPVYGVARAIPSVIRDLAVAAYALRTRGIHLDVLLLDDGSDSTAPVAARTAAELGLELEYVAGPSAGSGFAYLEGFRRVIADGRADVVVTLDANGRHDATQIPHLVDRLTVGDLHVVIGSRWVRGSGTPGLSVRRWALGRLANLAFRILTGTGGVRDATTSFRVSRLEVVRAFHLDGIPVDSHSVQTTFVAMAVANGFRVGEAPIIYRPPIDEGGELTRSDVAGFARHLLVLRGRVDRARQRRLSAAGRTFSSDYFDAAEDLERLGTAERFFDWVLDEFDPHLRGRVLEVGAGRGTITRMLLDRYPDLSVVALEPAGNLFDDLASFAALSPRASAHQETLVEFEVDPNRFDAVLYLNVLEHVQDDAREVKLAAEALRPGGALLIFGPALERLYSELDYRAGHYRRYSLDGLRQIATSAGLEVISARYFDLLGVLPYFVVYRLLRRSWISGSTLWGYDRLVVPFSRVLQRLLRRPPLGKNVILIARKPLCPTSPL